MNNHVAALAALFTDPPKLVDPISSWGIVGHGFFLILGLVALAAASVMWQNASGVVGGGMALVALCVVGYTENRFFRAIHPESVGIFRATLLAFIVLTLAAAWLAWRVDDSGAGGAIAVAAGGILAVFGAWGADYFYEYLAGIPMAIATLVALVALVALAVTTRR